MRFATRFLFLLALLVAPVASAQIVINEVDADSPGTDAAEFVELYNAGGASVDLSDLVLVFFNGSDDASYNAVDLDGITLDAGDYFVYCGDAANVANCDLEVGAGTENLIQNGADGVALFTGAASAFPEDTPASTTDLVDAVVYGTDDDDDAALLAALGETTQYDEAANGNKDTESVQRSPNGAETFVIAASTPGATNATVAPETFVALALGANEVPAVTSDGAGGITAVLTGTELVVTGRFDGLGSTYTASHLHEAAAGANGGVVQALSPTVDADELGGTFEAASNTFTVSSDVAQALRDGEIYINIHTTDNAGGEIRGQFGEDPPAATALTLAQARAAGVGFNVIVTGTVSRAAGAFSYIQEDGAGLTVRQTSGNYFDEVAGGTIQAGTSVTVTGTLSAFNGLLQINGSGLDSYTVGATGDAPAPVTVTLAELAANGEAYEGQLVTVAAVTFADAGTFATSTNYDVSDASSSDNAVSARVPGGNDTDVEDTAIPSVPTDVTGVVTEFGGDYQILLIQASDLAASTAGETGPEAEGFVLWATNPSPVGGSVTLTAPAAGDVTLELFDVVGRRVATLVDGPVLGERTVRLSDALAAGVYVLRLTTESGSLARTLTVVR